MAISGSFGKPDRAELPASVRQSPLPWVRVLQVTTEKGGFANTHAIAVGQTQAELSAYLELWLGEGNRPSYRGHKIDTVPYVGDLGER